MQYSIIMAHPSYVLFDKKKKPQPFLKARNTYLQIIKHLKGCSLNIQYYKEEHPNIYDPEKTSVISPITSAHCKKVLQKKKSL